MELKTLIQLTSPISATTFQIVAELKTICAITIVPVYFDMMKHYLDMKPDME